MMEFSRQRSRDTAASFRGTLFKTIKSVLLTPVVLASIFGIAANKIFNEELPRGLDEPLETLSNAFGAAALFYLGLSVVGKIRTKVGMIIMVPLSLGVAKVVILPLIIRGLCTSFNVGGDKMQEDWSTFGFLYGTIPPAPPTVIYAAAFGIQEDMVAFGLVMSTMFSAPVMFSSSKMSTVRNMNSTNIEYRNLLADTRNDISFVAIAIACWVIMVLFLSRRYKSPPHSYTICLVLSQLLLCFSFVLTKSDSFINCCKGLEVFLVTTFLFATHCWTALLAFALASLRCSGSERPSRNKLAMYIIGWGLPACFSGIVVLILKSDFEDYSTSEKDFFHFFNEKKTYLAFWVTFQFISIPVCVGYLVRLYRSDRFCKCEIMTNHEDKSEEETLLLSKSISGKCHRCKDANNCATPIETRSVANHTRQSTDVEDLDAIYSLVNYTDQNSDREKLGYQNSKLGLDKYYEGEQHQIGRHVIVIVSQVLLMIVCIFYCMWILVGDAENSGIFLEVQLLVSIILSAQILVVFAAFERERNLPRERPKDSRTTPPQSAPAGKAREILSQPPAEPPANHDTVKELIPNGYELVPEAHRQKPRNTEKTDHKTHAQPAQVKEQLSDRRRPPEKTKKEHKNLRELTPTEEPKRRANPEVRTPTNEQKPDSFTAAARPADDPAPTHKTTPEKKPQPNNSDNRHTPARKYPHDNRGKHDPRAPRDTTNPSRRRPPQNFQPNKTNPQNQTKPTGTVPTPDNNTTSAPDSNNASDTQEDPTKVKANADPIMKVFEPFVNAASVSPLNNPTQRTPVQVLRDTGASQSLILTNTPPPSAESYSGNNVLIKGVHSSDYSSVPLHNIRLHPDPGDVSIGTIDTPPLDGIQLLLGNDLAGEKATANPTATKKPCSTSISDATEQETPNLYPSCAVTRAMVKQQEPENNKRDDLDSSYDLSDTFPTQPPDSGPKTTQNTKNDATDTKSPPTPNPTHEQNNDPEIAILIQQAFDEKEISDQAMGHPIKNDILMRKWRPPDVSVDDERPARHQTAIPKPHREEVLRPAHETPLSGHPGINKTYEKITRHFYWPGVRKTVAEFRKTCHTRQAAGKPNQLTPKAPLKPIPASEEPPSRTTTDRAGPLPKTKRGKQHPPTTTRAPTRSPEATPPRNTKAKTTAEAPTKPPTPAGPPKSIQSDQGPNPTSGLFQQIMHEL
ncbi:Hypothetical predicted protein, partial [Paramuricea clavata]